MVIIGKLISKSPTFFGENSTVFENLSFDASVTEGSEPVKFTMSVTNPFIAAGLEIGKSYSFDITEVV